MLLRNFEHPEMDCGVLVAGEANVPDLAGFASGNRGFDCAADAEDAVGIFHPDDLMELHKVDHVCLQTAQRLFELLIIRVRGAAVHLGHEQDLLPVAVAECLAHANLGQAVAVIPAVVHESDATIDGSAGETDALGSFLLAADVTAAETDRGNDFAGCAELAVDHVRRLRPLNSAWSRRCIRPRLRKDRRRCTNAEGGRGLKKFSALHERGSRAATHKERLSKSRREEADIRLLCARVYSDLRRRNHRFKIIYNLCYLKMRHT